MARPLSGSQKSRWKNLGNFSVLVVADSMSSTERSYEAAAFNGTLLGLAAIASASGINVRDVTSGTTLYTIANANTPYTGTPSSPLFSYNYTAYNKIGLSSNPALFAGIIGTIPDGFQVAVACFRSTAAQSITVASGPAMLKYFKLAFIPLGGGQGVTVSAGTNGVKRVFSSPGTSSNSQCGMEFIHLGMGGPFIPSGQNLTISFEVSTTTLLVGIFLLEV
jgi:hypothetical protein